MTSDHAAPLHRSYLFAPGSSERLLGKVLAAGADAVILDLEDAVAPAEKVRARDAVAAWLAALPHRGSDAAQPSVYVRVNQRVTQRDAEVDPADLAAVVTPALTGVAVPKVASAALLVTLDRSLAVLEERLGLTVGSVRILPLVESAAGVLAARDIAGATARIDRISYGAVDLATELAAPGIPADPGGPATDLAAGYLVLASRAAGSGPPVEAVSPVIADSEALRAATRRAAARGFFGRLVIHPEQLAPVHDVFTPGPETLRHAAAVVAVFETALAQGSGVAVLDGRLVELPVAVAAEQVLALGRRLGLTVPA
jgi:citrate lyase subunit beta / citryl-CoA lyase